MKDGAGPFRVLVADDHPLFRRAFGAMISAEEGLEAVGEAEDGLEAVELCRELRPDLILMDLSMPRMGGLEATREIKGSFPETVVLIVTADDSEDLMLEAIRAGAAGYVLKIERPERLVSAARAALAGESPIDAGLAGRLVRRIAAEGEEGMNGRPELAFATPTVPLTPREIEVLGLVVTGKTNRLIAGELHMSLSTVKRHLERVVKKLGVSDRTQAAVRAMELGLISG
ncbi:response regulator [Rubrobacter tropicus]|uniref:Response regulator n=1 Tax=Rubrobacter tropicus TaxID=2653851 RepID=A0A6G8Q8Z8_9ACTN|nr:response regulator transcription factor [Rubrobacter tropicus]QIN82787.1 response regulator [Rubrobacter tropicus]